MAEPKITRYLRFVVEEAHLNDYGDLIVTSQGGHEYKIGNKRERLFDLFQPGAEVIVGYASYKNRDYIAVAYPAEGFPPGKTVEDEGHVNPPQDSSPATPATHAPQGDKTPQRADSKESSRESSRESSIETQVAIKEIGLAYCAGKLEKNDPLVIGWRCWCYSKLGISVSDTIAELKSLNSDDKLALKAMLTERAGQ